MNFGLLVMGLLLFFTSLFLIMLILVQRGRGGGLTGALGGMGGQSAFGSKAGDAFTKLTVGTAIFWILLSMLTIQFFNPPPRVRESEEGIGAPANTSETDVNEEGENKDDSGTLGESSGDNKTDDDAGAEGANPSGDGNFNPGGEVDETGDDKTGDDKTGDDKTGDDKTGDGGAADPAASKDGTSDSSGEQADKSKAGKSDGKQ